MSNKQTIGERIASEWFEAGISHHELRKVNPKNTSQTCCGCGQIVRKGLKERTHWCDCGTVLDRDVNAARVILSRGGIAPWSVNVADYRERPIGNISVAG